MRTCTHTSYLILFSPPLLSGVQCGEIPRGVQLSTSLSTHMRMHTHTSYLILFSSPLLSGVQCGECSAGFYGKPGISGAPCRPCACNNNIDVTDAGSCSPATGECLKCLYNTQGPNCQLCKPGNFGSALDRTCMSKSAKLLAGNVQLDLW